MKTGRMNIIWVVSLLTLAGCATGPSGYKAGSPILSAADAQAMINVEVRELEPLPVESAVASN